MINVQCTPATCEFSQTMYAVQLPEMTPRILQVFPANASLEVIAMDEANPTRSGRTTVFVIVEDFCCLSINRTCRLNSHAPIFSAPLYFVNVMEGDYSTNNQLLIEISAVDNDFGPDGDLVFEIQSVSNKGMENLKYSRIPQRRKHLSFALANFQET